MNKTMQRLWLHIGTAVVTLGAHAISALFMIAVIVGMKHLTEYLLSDTLVFGRFPVGYIFDFGNFSVLITFVAQGIFETLKSLRTGTPLEPAQEEKIGKVNGP